MKLQHYFVFIFGENHLPKNFQQALPETGSYGKMQSFFIS